IPALVERFKEKDAGFEAMGHLDGSLHKAVVQALARMANEEALTALYDGLSSKNARQACSDFWFNTKEKGHLDAFLRRYDKQPIDALAGAGIVYSLLQKQAPVQLKQKEREAAEKEFLIIVRDPAHFGKNVDLTEAGKYAVRIDFSFYPAGFSSISFTFKDVRP